VLAIPCHEGGSCDALLRSQEESVAGNEFNETPREGTAVYANLVLREMSEHQIERASPSAGTRIVGDNKSGREGERDKESERERKGGHGIVAQTLSSSILISFSATYQGTYNANQDCGWTAHPTPPPLVTCFCPTLPHSGCSRLFPGESQGGEGGTRRADGGGRSVAVLAGTGYSASRASGGKQSLPISGIIRPVSSLPDSRPPTKIPSNSPPKKDISNIIWNDETM